MRKVQRKLFSDIIMNIVVQLENAASKLKWTTLLVKLLENGFHYVCLRHEQLRCFYETFNGVENIVTMGGWERKWEKKSCQVIELDFS